MRLTVIDPRLLVKPFQHPLCNTAKLLTLFAYGRVSLNAQGCPHWEVEQMVDEAKALGASIDISVHNRRAEREVEHASRRKVAMEEAFELHVPDDLLLVTSPPIIQDLLLLAQEAQGAGHPRVRPDQVVHQIARHTFLALEDLGPAPSYLSKGRISRYDYLIHTAMEAHADTLITDDTDLLLEGDLSYQSQKTGHTVRPYSQEEFIAELPSHLDLSRIDPYTALHAAVVNDSAPDRTAVAD